MAEDLTNSVLLQLQCTHNNIYFLGKSSLVRNNNNNNNNNNCQLVLRHVTTPFLMFRSIISIFTCFKNFLINIFIIRLHMPGWGLSVISLFISYLNLSRFNVQFFYPFKHQYPHTNSPNWYPYISFKNKFREYDKRSKHFHFDHFINSHNLISWHCMDIIRRKLTLVTIGTGGWRTLAPSHLDAFLNNPILSILLFTKY